MKENEPVAFSWFTRSTRRYTPMIVELMVIAIVVRLIGLVQPFVFQTLIDRVLPFQRMASLDLILVILIGSTLFSAALGVLSSVLGTVMANRLTAELGERVFDHVLKLPLAQLQRFHVGELMARIREIDTVRAFLTGTIADMVLDLLFAFVYVAALLALSPKLTAIVLLALPLQLALFGVFGPFLRRRLQEGFAAGATYQSRIVEAFGNIATVKALASEERQRERVTRALSGSLLAGWRTAKLNIANGTAADILSGVSAILVIYFGAQLVFAGELTLGQLIAFHLISGNVSGPILSLSTVWEQWQGLRISRIRLGDLLNQPTEADAGLPLLPKVGGAVLRAEAVIFGYMPERPVISGFSAVFKPGRANVIVGDSGCGKSTLAKLLCGLHSPQSGKIFFGEHDISEHDPASVRRRIGYVPQEPVLFAGTIRENLLMSRPDASELLIEQAIAASASHGFVATLQRGLDTEVGDRGSQLSGGQRQRIALARALLTEPDMLVLDEPTSSLDDATALEVMETLKDLARDRIVLIVTHRPDLVAGRKQVLNLSKSRGIAAA